MAQAPARIEPALARSIRHLVARLADLHALLPQVNDPDLQARLRLLATIGPDLGRAHLPAPGPDVADALAGLLAAALALDVPEEDPDLGPTPTLSAILSVKGLIIGGATNALKAADAAGFIPARDPIPREQAVTIPRLRYQDQLRSIEQRLGDVVTRLDALDRTRDSLEQQRPAFVQQNGLINLYVGAMRVEVDLVKLQLTVGGTTLDLGVLARASQAMGRLTGDFVATIRGWSQRVAQAVTTGAEAMRVGVKRLVTRVRAFTRALWIEARRGSEPAPLTIRRDAPDLPEMVLIPLIDCDLGALKADAFRRYSGKPPPGTFTMGASKEEDEREGVSYDDHRPVHLVTIAKPFWLARYPLTRGEYAAFVQDTGYDQDKGAWRDPGFPQDDRHPVVNIRHEDALAYIDWLNKRTRGGYRLPSEAEWEYACRAGTATARFWGDAWDGHEPYAWADRKRGTAPVDDRQPNRFKLHDMLGNVWEWCADPWHDSYEGAPDDGSVWETKEDSVRRVLRGGSWDFNPWGVRAGVRLYDVDRLDFFGCRLARTSF